jgi:solute carrier family 12 sodium/potassium/chloride transporter 2
MPKTINTSKANFGTMPIFITAISTILGAILFLRFGYTVGHTGLLGVFAIIILGHLITNPTALSVAEIATNQKVEGGGAYYIISRSFGLNIGAAIGISLFLSQAISVAELLKKQKEELFNGYDNLGNVLFVNSISVKEIINKEN